MSPVKVSCSQPLCPAELQKTHKNGVEIDYCPHCKGIWLDKGELEKYWRTKSRRCGALKSTTTMPVKSASISPTTPSTSTTKKAAVERPVRL